MKRGSFLSLLGAKILLRLKSAMARTRPPGGTLLSAPLEIGGTWGGSAPADVAAVVERMRTACLADVLRLSDRQPAKLRVDNRRGANPSIWLHTNLPTTAWITVVVVEPRDWCNLAYQFGHELGHVFSNSWESVAKPHNPCQWIEEALVEAFSLRGLALLAENWAKAPPFPNDAAYAGSIRNYRETIVADYRTAAREEGAAAGFGAWFKTQELFLQENGGVKAARGAVSTMLDLLESDAAMVADMGVLNRWPGRSGVRLPDYLALWEASCVERNAPGRLPVRIRELLAGP
jgi:hypothetical protein